MAELPNPEPVEDILSPRHEAFCRYYTQNKRLFGNGTLSYAEAYGYDLDTLPDDDAVYLLKSGEEVLEYDYVNLSSEVTKGAIKIKDSTRKITYDYCSQSASRLLRNVKIDKRVKQLLVESLDDELVDSTLTEIIVNGGKDSDRVNAIKVYNDLKQRIIKKIDLTTGGQPLKHLTDDELAAIAGGDETPSSEGSQTGTSQEGIGEETPAELHSVPLPELQSELAPQETVPSPRES